MKKTFKSLVTGLMATGCQIAYGETQNVGRHLPPHVLEEWFITPHVLDGAPTSSNSRFP